MCVLASHYSLWLSGCNSVADWRSVAPVTGSAERFREWFAFDHTSEHAHEFGGVHVIFAARFVGLDFVRVFAEHSCEFCVVHSWFTESQQSH